ncbi:hypothetical protein LUD75_07065 [Epilithonimonas sp. JDS]|uniref:hypothetical protein n=1 Tax=Epilithonimonas sp. JDS TaxID=2902797 RepID=UPI001E630904|nr:hypothetical protein [Epilithonimonas sp. JDS]MCD9854459.1 hypothetical protein [Epilithonimonas sp. JDS]
MKTLKIISLLLLMIGLMSCGRDNNEPEVVEEPFDITQYVIVSLSKKNSNIHYIQTFEKDAEGVSMDYSAFLVIKNTFTFQDGVLKTFSNITSNKEFKIENGSIISASNSEDYINKLVKIPSTNQLNGNTYSGSWRKDGSNLLLYSKLKFTNTHFSEGSLNLPEPNTSYEIIKNIGALSVTAGKRTLWVLVDGKLEGSRLFSGVSAGTFTKQ